MVNKLEIFLEDSAIDAELVEITRDTDTVKQASDALNASPNSIVKSLVFECGENFVVAVVSGNDRVDTKKLGEVMECDNVSIATPEAVEKITGFSVGNVPPVGYEVRKVVDEKVLEKEEVFGGGGDENHMIMIDPRFIVGENDIVVDIGGGE